jgi:hypothetical protein
MAYNLSNYSDSAVYSSYSQIYNANNITFKDHSPYQMFLNLETYKLFKNYAIDNLADSNNTYYRNSIPYFFRTYVCSDSAADINNIGKNVNELKVPLEYFVNGKLLGVDKRFQSVENGAYLYASFTTDPITGELVPPEGWSFFNDFDEKTNYNKSKTNNLDSISEAIFYNTYFEYFNFYKYFGAQIPTLFSIKDYTVKGNTSDINNKDGSVTTVYNAGKGEAPNFIDISVNSYQKIKNKVSLNVTAVRTSYLSNFDPPKQIVFKDTKEELLSAFRFFKGNTPIINDFSDKLSLTSLSNDTLDMIIHDYIISATEYFNLVHFILKSAIINYEFIKQYSKQPDSDIFDVKDPSSINGKIIISIKNLEFYKNNTLVKQFGLYTKQLIINLLNIVGSDEAVDNTVNLFLDFLEQNEPQIKGNYKRDELKDLLKQINDLVFQVYKTLEPQIQVPSNNGKIKVNLNLEKYNIPADPISSNDLILQKVYVYRMLDKPTSYEEILQPQNLYKVSDYASGLVTISDIKTPRTIEDSVTIIDDVKVNTKYYYCFLSQREYDVYAEVFNKKDMSRSVEHFSSPTKVLEIEMVSTDNSTYLDYSFFIPENKIIVDKKENFLSKIRISPSSIQKDPALYDKNKKDFNIPKGLLPFWTKIAGKLVDSSDLNTGKTIKIRITSPKTKKKIDINIRHFLETGLSKGYDFKEVTIDDIKNASYNKTYVELESKLQPVVIFNFYNKQIDTTNFNKPENIFDPKTKINVTKTFKNFTYNIKKDAVGDFFIGGIINNNFKEFLLDSNNNLINLNYNIKILDKDRKTLSDLGISGKNVSPDLKNLSVPWSKNIKDEINGFSTTFAGIPATIRVEQSFVDSYKANHFNYLEFDAIDVTPTYDLKINGAPYSYLIGITETATVNGTVTTTNIEDGKKLKWSIVNLVNYDANNFLATSGDINIKTNAGTFTFNTLANNADQVGPQSFQIQIIDEDGNVVINTQKITVSDTTTAKYAIATMNNSTSVDEGSQITFNVSSTGTANGTLLYWSVVNNNSSAPDFNSPLNGIVTINNNKGSFFVSIKADNLSEGAETFKVVLSKTKDGSVIAESTTITINDTSKNQSFVPSGQPGSETNPFLTFEEFKPNESGLSKQYKNIYYISSQTRNLFQSIYDENANYITTKDLGSSGILGSKNNPYPTFGDYQNAISSFNKKYRDTYYVDNTTKKEILSRFDYAKTGNYITPNTKAPPSDDANYINDLGVYLPALPNPNPVLTSNAGLLRPSKDGKNIDFSDTSLTNWQGIVVGTTDLTKGNIYYKQAKQYSSDSNWGAAAVHAGLIKPGEKAVIFFRAIGKVGNFNVNTANSITSTAYGNIWDVFEIGLVRKIP